MSAFALVLIGFFLEMICNSLYTVKHKFPTVGSRHLFQQAHNTCSYEIFTIHYVLDGNLLRNMYLHNNKRFMKISKFYSIPDVIKRANFLIRIKKRCIR